MKINGVIHHKKACSRGKDLSICRVNSDCDTRPGAGDGVCTEYPFGGETFGNDDYKRPQQKPGLGAGPKKHDGLTILWWDAPGMPHTRRADFKAPHELEGTFRASVLPSALVFNPCTCVFTLKWTWDGTRFTRGPTFELDVAQSTNCTKQ